MRCFVVSTSVILLCGLAASVRAETSGAVFCLPPDARGALHLQLAQSDNHAGIVSRTGDSVRFKPGYTFRSVKRGGKTLMLVSLPNTKGAGGTVDCTCSAGACFPVQEGNSVYCKSHPGQCNAGCGMVLTHIPTPKPP